MYSLIKNIFSKPIILNFITVLAGLSFFLLCMILPLVGPAGSKVEHADYNKTIFLSWLIFTLVFSLTSFCLRLRKYKIEKNIFPIYSLILLAVCILIFIIHQFNGFSI